MPNMNKIKSSLSSFHGLPSDELTNFFFFFDFVFVRHKTVVDNAAELLSHLDGSSFDLMFDTLPDPKTGVLTPGPYDYETVKAALRNHFEKPQTPQDDILTAVELTFAL